jgi:hypothetical protein
VREDVGVGVTREPALAGDLDAAEDQPPPLLEAMRVDPDPGAHQPTGSSRRCRPSNTQISLTPVCSSSSSASS